MRSQNGSVKLIELLDCFDLVLLYFNTFIKDNHYFNETAPWVHFFQWGCYNLAYNLDVNVGLCSKMFFGQWEHTAWMEALKMALTFLFRSQEKTLGFPGLLGDVNMAVQKIIAHIVCVCVRERESEWVKESEWKTITICTNTHTHTHTLIQWWLCNINRQKGEKQYC